MSSGGSSRSSTRRTRPSRGTRWSSRTTTRRWYPPTSPTSRWPTTGSWCPLRSERPPRARRRHRPSHDQPPRARLDPARPCARLLAPARQQRAALTSSRGSGRRAAVGASCASAVAAPTVRHTRRQRTASPSAPRAASPRPPRPRATAPSAPRCPRIVPTCMRRHAAPARPSEPTTEPRAPRRARGQTAAVVAGTRVFTRIIVLTFRSYR